MRGSVVRPEHIPEICTGQELPFLLHLYDLANREHITEEKDVEAWQEIAVLIGIRLNIVSELTER